MIRRVFVEKKAGYDTVRQKKQAEIESALGVKFAGMRMLIRYDIEGMDDVLFVIYCGLSEKDDELPPAARDILPRRQSIRCTRNPPRSAASS